MQKVNAVAYQAVLNRPGYYRLLLEQYHDPECVYVDIFETSTSNHPYMDYLQPLPMEVLKRLRTIDPAILEIEINSDGVGVRSALGESRVMWGAIEITRWAGFCRDTALPSSSLTVTAAWTWAAARAVRKISALDVFICLSIPGPRKG